jgi:hypothetical protein
MDFESSVHIMIVIKIFLTFVISLAIWLLIGGPGLEAAGSLVIFSFLIIHLLTIIWNRETFKLFGGDEFTYGMVTQSINMLSFIYSLVITFVIFHFYGQSIQSFGSIPKYLWGALTLGLIGSFAIQIQSTRHVEPLADRDDRRVFEKPRMD